MEVIASSMACTTATFPCTYLGLLISNKKLRRCDLLPWIEIIGDKLSRWKASLMNMVGRTVWVKFVMTVLSIHMLVAINVLKWFINVIDKYRTSFLWRGRQQVNGGSCLVSWDKVQRPLHLGGLGILNLHRWLWF